MSTKAFTAVLIALMLVPLVQSQAQTPVLVAIQANFKNPETATIQKALDISLRRVNEQGGLLGRKLELFFFDEGSDASTSMTNAQDAIKRRPVAVIGPSTVGFTLPVASSLAKSKVLYIVPRGDPRILADAQNLGWLTGSNYLVLSGPPLSKEGQAVATVLRNIVKAKGVGISIDDSLSNYYGNAAQWYLERAGISASLRGPDLLAKDPKLDAVYAPTSASFRTLIKSVNERNWKGSIIMGGTAASLIFQKPPSGIAFYAIVPLGGEFQAFADNYQKIYGQQERVFVAAPWVDALELLVSAIQRTRTTEPEALGKFIRGGSEYKGVTGLLTFRNAERISVSWSYIRHDSSGLSLLHLLLSSGPTDPDPPVPPPVITPGR